MSKSNNKSVARCIVVGWLGAAVLVASGAQAAGEPINEEARRHFNAGVSLLQDPDGARYEDAYREFEAAYAASLSSKILGNIGFCALKLERDDEAITAYTRYLAEVHDVDPAEAAQISRDIATLRAGLVRVTITVDAHEATVVDRRLPVRGDTVTNFYGPVKGGRLEVGLRPGHHVIELKVEGETFEPWDFDAKPSGSFSHAFTTIKPVEAPHRSFSHPLPWIVTGLGAATLAAGGVMGVLTLDKVNAIASNCPGNECPPSYALKPAQDDARRFRTITDTLFVGGGLIAATGVYLLFSMSTTEAPHAAKVETHTATATPYMACSPSGCVAALAGSF